MPAHDVRIPPINPSAASDPDRLVASLLPLLGTEFRLSGKPRTDGAALRHLVTAKLASAGLPEPAIVGSYEVVPPKGKGVPRILREIVDSYLVTTGSAYNLQVWNRLPASSDPLIRYKTGETIVCRDVRFVFARHDPANESLGSIAVLTPDYIEAHFGDFGKPTIKEQLIISESARQFVLRQPNSVLFYPDSGDGPQPAKDLPSLSDRTIKHRTERERLVSLATLRDIVISEIIGLEVPNADTKTRGQFLERRILEALGYPPSVLLEGGFPDIPHQALEVKVQDRPTIDLGRFSPHLPRPVPNCHGYSTETVRYLIALCDAETSRIVGAVVAPGARLGDHFSYVATSNYKCQRSIPMDFLAGFGNGVVFNP